MNFDGGKGCARRSCYSVGLRGDVAWLMKDVVESPGGRD